MLEFYAVSKNVYALSSSYHIPRFGNIPVNAYVILGEEPILVDAGLGRDRDDFINALKSIVDPVDLRWIWLTHDDLDHTGNIQPVLKLAPKAKLAMHVLAAFRMNTSWQVPLQRVYALSEGEKIMVGSQTLRTVKPPLYDTPYTVGLFLEESKTLFTADAFGAVLQRKERKVNDLSDEELEEGMIKWASIDSPWVHLVDPHKYGETLNQIDLLNSQLVLSSHLPVAYNATHRLVEVLRRVPSTQPFKELNQTAFKRILEESGEIITY